MRKPLLALWVALTLTPCAPAAELVFSHERGFYDAAFELAISTDLEAATIRFTTDGSAPTKETGDVYSTPISIAKTTPARAIAYAGETELRATHSFLFLANVATQEAYPEGYIDAIESARNGSRKPHTFDWAMDPEVLDDTANNGNLVEHLRSIPTLALTMEVADFNFVYENHTSRGAEFERATAVELIYPSDDERYSGFDGFQTVAGIRMQGGGAVDQARKKSFRLLFKEEYGFPKLEYPLFESAAHHAGSAARRFDNVVLRAAGNTNWSKDDAWKHEPSTYLRDPFSRDSQIAISGFGARSTFVHTYINGYYFGLYNIAERPDDKFMAEYFGGEREDYYSINHGGTVEGSSSEWSQITGSSNTRNLDDPERYESFQERFDVEAYCDYVLLNWLIGMGDWPWNNFYGGMRNEPDGKVRFFSWDSEYAFWTLEGYLGSNPNGWVNSDFNRGRSVIPTLWRALDNSDAFLMTFADRVYKHCFNNGPLTDENIRARFQRLATHIEGAIVAESAKWGDSSWGREDDPHTREGDWRPNVQAVLELMDGNVEKFISALREDDYYPDTNPPAFPMPTAPVAPGFSFTIENAHATGDVFYTTDGTDPSAATAKKYASDESITIEDEMLFRARTQRNGEWSALAEHHFTLSGIGFPLRITEIMYHPNGETQALEFVELQNIGSLTHDLSGYSFRGIDFRFAPDTSIAPNEVIVLIRNDDPTAFAAAYPGTTVAGTYRGGLDNSGETIALRDPFGATIDSVKYDDEAPWDEPADGAGMSLTRIDLTGAANEASNWAGAAASPGAVVPITRTELPDVNAKIDLERREVTVSFSAVAGSSYAVERSASLDDEWVQLEEFAAGDERDVSATDQVPAQVSERYYRVRIR